jgi:hypothetical protein
MVKQTVATRALWAGYTSGAVPSSPADPAGSTVAYLSARPGTLGAATSILIRSPRANDTHWLLTPALGGVDPTAIPAAAGDTLVVMTTTADGVASAIAIVPSTSAPHVVRTEPATGQSDIPLNARLQAVFSEPVFPTSGMMQLFANQSPLGGHVRANQPSNTVVEFIPDSTLQAERYYRLVVTSLVRGYYGSMGAPVEAGFLTAPAASLSPASLTIASFVIVKFHYPSDPSQRWYYAPLLTVKETSGLGTATITKIAFSIGWSFCVTGRQVAAGQTLQVFQEIYGDYPLEFDGGDLDTLQNMFVTVSYTDATGQANSISAIGSFVYGDLPTTYTGGHVQGSFTMC